VGEPASPRRHDAGMKDSPVPPPAVRQARVNGVNLTYLEQGEGAPIVFVHGTLSDYRAWEGQREPVAQHFRCIVLTQRYYGLGPWPDKGEKFSRATHIDDLGEFIRGLKAGPVHLVGWSYGGSIALTLAVQQPELVKSLFVYEHSLVTIVTDPTDAKAVGDERKDIRTQGETAFKTGDLAKTARLLVDAIHGQPGIFDTLSASMRVAMLDNARTIPLDFGAPPPPAVSCAQLGQIKVPVAIAVGELTRPSYKILADTASRCIPGSRLIVIPNGRHSALSEAPTAFNEALRGFLKDQ
jgi:pimeloyl-ACP methyl ester carboxylesterase